MLITFCSPGRAPGASTAALAITLAWPRDIILAECDPSGGTVYTGACLSFLPAKGLPQWAAAVSRGADPDAELSAQLLPLTRPHRQVLALPPGPAPVHTLTPAWPALATALGANSRDVIADVGRIGGTDTPVPLLTAASQVILVTRPDYPGLAAAASALRWLAAISSAPVAIMLNGTGTYPRPVVARDLPAPVLAVLPHDPRSARRLRDGIGPRRRSPLGRRAAAVATDLATAENPTEEGESRDRAA